MPAGTATDYPRTPAAHVSRERALTIAADTVERELEWLRGVSVNHPSEDRVMQAMELGSAAGRLRAMEEEASE